MNERIKELTGKALDEAMPQTWYGISPDDLDRIAATLAELIVRECSRYIEDKFDFCGDEIIIAESVLKHFGVEE